MTLNFNEEMRKNNENISNVIPCVTYLAKHKIAFRDNDEKASVIQKRGACPPPKQKLKHIHLLFY